ncbi:dihydrodipicolinate synthase family protein [Rhizobium lentis]|uniref:dihydrodipicolinate synthase family protein n=1 Tax=Rhizobium TaxID=379 RepID=UPI001C82913A|nr:MULTISPECIES: dihydrodipicolinate synthase family protein [Rhizobium]MBX5132356.1 dihydrodipicolinate synthase family protein [Rhizobium lentis]MBX5214058.1 dihydrodipicolinate synthase family protein [Rhizobium sp. NLR9a]MBX5219200.1 dihydrodipicolinate synthase family protein [Rhizobium sp. NLR8a]MBX5275035.1 dihydrodipicolinate synthase family protein [Rhizobium sp. NLR13a]MBX5281234.1 dihydrodipicolinate synthase family protein [Rhizobium sp. NLR10a]
MSLFEGLSAFPITPADASGRVDAAALAMLLQRIVDAGADSIGLLGSTGAYAFLTRDERRRAVETAIRTVGGRIPVIVGVGALRTDEAQVLAHDAKEAGADGLLLAPVSYVPLTGDEVFEHFATVTRSGGLPLCIYNNPSTTRFTFSSALIARLATVPNIAAIKMPLPANEDFKTELEDLRGKSPTGFSIGYSGDWGASSALLAGADAWYSVVAGVLPAEALALATAARAGNTEEVERLEKAFEPLWSLFKRFGSFRVMYRLVALLGIGDFEPPRPVRPIPDSAVPDVVQALNHLRGAFQ